MSRKNRLPIEINLAYKITKSNFSAFKMMSIFIFQNIVTFDLLYFIWKPSKSFVLFEHQKNMSICYLMNARVPSKTSIIFHIFRSNEQSVAGSNWQRTIKKRIKCISVIIWTTNLSDCSVNAWLFVWIKCTKMML